MDYSLPNKNNFCGGNFNDWLEVMLEPKCNGKCSFCIEKNGFRPKEKASTEELINAIVGTNKTNIILLGGEPTLYPNLKQLIRGLNKHNKKVYITTNGSQLMKKDGWINNITELEGLNISIHHYDLKINEAITGIYLDKDFLKYQINALGYEIGMDIRLNCNLIDGFIDSRNEILKYIEFAKDLRVDSVRFAELKFDDRFVDLAKIFNYEYGLNDDPYTLGCWQNANINNMSVNFRQMCGIQTDKRKKPDNPKHILKEVLYYNGKVYAGWQTKGADMEDNGMFKEVIEQVLSQVENATLSADSGLKIIMAAAKKLEKVVEKERIVYKSEPVCGNCGGCHY